MHCGLRWLLLGFKLPEDALVSVERAELKQRSKSLGRVCLVPGGGGDEGGGYQEDFDCTKSFRYDHYLHNVTHGEQLGYWQKKKKERNLPISLYMQMNPFERHSMDGGRYGCQSADK